MRAFIQKYYQPWFCALILSLFGIGLRVCTLAGRPLSGDEIFQFNNVTGPFKPFWQHLHYGDHTSFPGDYLLTYPFVRIFGLNKWALSIPHLILTALGFYLLFRLCRGIFRTTTATVITFALYAVNQNLIYHALEFRSYSVLPVLAVGNYYFWDLIINDYSNLKPWQRWGIGCFFIFTSIYHSYGILIFILPLIYLIWDQPPGGRGAAKKYMGIMICLGVSLWAWYASANFFGIQFKEGIYSAKDTFRYIPNPLMKPLGFLKGVVGNLLGCRPLYFLLLGPVVSFFVPQKEVIKKIIFFALFIIVPITLILLIDIRNQYWFVQRQFVWIMPYFAIWIGWCWDSLFIYRTEVLL